MKHSRLLCFLLIAGSGEGGHLRKPGRRPQPVLKGPRPIWYNAYIPASPVNNPKGIMGVPAD
jgi:hypothetical protein